MKTTTCNQCPKENPRTFPTHYGYRMHLNLVHGLKEKDGKMVRLRKKSK